MIKAFFRRYWSCTQFADKLRGTPKPKGASLEGWKEWNKTAQNAHPTRYWLAENGLDHLETITFFIPDTFKATRSNLRNRFDYKTHCMTAHPKDIPPGRWCDLSHRLVYCCFNELVNFIEVEKAGLAYLEWEMGLTWKECGMEGDDLTPQAESARELMELYRWWTEVRPKRLTCLCP
eukprot:TRINITY_DN14326_c0_g2_i1.p1 TRINITY_DN14326_c0_g2~~TRINITY_DN14326_c0_g2_i1.p1  ORF type:complete len:177 (-),score=35.39 TRINITY_DN14326_c0_g2_i1:236-766(-)